MRLPAALVPLYRSVGDAHDLIPLSRSSIAVGKPEPPFYDQPIASHLSVGKLCNVTKAFDNGERNWELPAAAAGIHVNGSACSALLPASLQTRTRPRAIASETAVAAFFRSQALRGNTRAVEDATSGASHPCKRRWEWTGPGRLTRCMQMQAYRIASEDRWPPLTVEPCCFGPRGIHHTLSHIVLPECVRKCDIMSRTCVNAAKQRPWKGVSTDVQYGGLHCLGSSLGLERPLLLIISPLMLRICHRDCRGFPRTPQRERFGHPRDQPHRVPMHDAGLIYDRLHPNKPAYLNTNKPDPIHS